MESEHLGHIGQEDFLDDVDLEKVIAASQCADLRGSSLSCPIAHLVGISSLEASTLLRVIKVARVAVSLFDCPTGTLFQDTALFGGSEPADGP